MRPAPAPATGQAGQRRAAVRPAARPAPAPAAGGEAFPRRRGERTPGRRDAAARGGNGAPRVTAAARPRQARAIPPVLTPQLVAASLAGLAASGRVLCGTCGRAQGEPLPAGGQCRRCSRRAALLQDYQFLLRHRETPEAAAARVGVSSATIARYEKEARHLRACRRAASRFLRDLALPRPARRPVTAAMHQLITDLPGRHRICQSCTRALVSGERTCRTCRFRNPADPLPRRSKRGERAPGRRVLPRRDRQARARAPGAPAAAGPPAST